MTFLSKRQDSQCESVEFSCPVAYRVSINISERYGLTYTTQKRDGDGLWLTIKTEGLGLCRFSSAAEAYEFIRERYGTTALVEETYL